MRQGNNGVSTSQPESKKKRKSSFNPIDEPEHPNKRIQVSTDSDEISKTMVEVAGQPRQEP